MIEKLLICPFFGAKPPWMKHWYANIRRMTEHGYSFFLPENEDEFRRRVKKTLGIECPPMAGTGNVWDFRPAFGVIYADEIQGFDFWGHTDFDCVYGRVERWVTDEMLYHVDVFSNHDEYVMGAFSLYRNQPFVNGLFAASDEWRDQMTTGHGTGWVEAGYSDLVRKYLPLRHRFASWQTRDWNDFSTLQLFDDGGLWEGDTEVMMAHFRRTKEYPGRVHLVNVVDLGCATWGNWPDSNSIERLAKRFRPERLFGFDPARVVNDGQYQLGTTTVTVTRAAAWTYDGTVVITGDGSSTYVTPEGIMPREADGHYPAQCFDLARWLLDYGQKVIVKMDVEGAEHVLVPHLIATGAIELVDLLLLEVHGNSLACAIPGAWEAWV